MSKTKKTVEKKVLYSLKYGKLEFTEKDLFYMTTPLLGFAHLSDFLLISSEEHLPFYIFHSAEDPTVSFIVVDITMFFPDYAPDIHKRDLKILQAKSVNDLKLFGIVVVPPNPKDATINLKAPLAINPQKRLAKQIILEDDRYQIKTPLFKE
ncbi:MAG: flagellar assembly protein FliW [Calditerrivibrio sp.]|nr:flagellar assembly protein FliW [Calditerrivibrio sp.]